MEKIYIKKKSEVDKKELLDFYQHSFNLKNINLEDYNWRYRYDLNSFEPLILEIDGKICGHAGIISNKIKILNDVKTGVWFTDFFIDEKYRSLGYGRLLAEAWMKICPIRITICNDKSLKIFKKLNWSYNNKLTRQLKFYNFQNLIYFFKKNKNTDIETGELGNLQLKNIDNQTISKIIENSEKTLSQKTIGIVRDESWFKWRILNCPYKKNIYIFTYDGIDIITNIKVKKKFKILNIIYISKPVNFDLKNIFSKFAKKNKIDFLSYISKSNQVSNIDMPWRKKLNFAFDANDFFIKDLIKKRFEDIQFIDTDIDFV